MGPNLLKPKDSENIGTITLNLTPKMLSWISTDKNRSKKILGIVKEYLDQCDPSDFEGTDERVIITVSKPKGELYNKIYKAVKSGYVLSRTELFRRAILWDRDKKRLVNREQLEEDAKNGVVRVPNDEPQKEELVFNVIGIA